MSVIRKQDTDGTKGTLSAGELGYDKYPAGGDEGRVYVGTGTINLPLAKKSEIDGVDTRLGVAETKLAGIEAGAEVNLVDSVAGKTGVVVLDKSDVGLDLVDNTSDLGKPISTATQTALDTIDSTITGIQGQVDTIDSTITTVQGQVNSNTLVTGTSTQIRYDKILNNLDVIEMLYTGDGLTTVRYSGDNDTTAFYRDVLEYTGSNLTTIKHYYGTPDTVTHSAITTLAYDGSDNLLSATYTEL